MIRAATVLAAALVLAAATPPPVASAGADTFLVTGTVVDTAGVRVPFVRVRVFEEDLFADTLLNTTYTAADGTFAVAVAKLEDEPDIYVIVDWMVRITSIPGRHFILQDQRTVDATPNTSNPFDAVRVCDFDNLPVVAGSVFPCGNVATVDALNPARASYTNLWNLLNQSFKFYKDRQGTVPWVVNYDPKVRIHTDSVVSFQSNTTVNIADVDINGVNAGPGQGFQTDLYHETGHLVHDEAYMPTGLPFPDGVNDTSHRANSEKSPGFAITEGWASFMQEITARVPGNSSDGKAGMFRPDGAFRNWRGGSPEDEDGTFENRNGARGLHGAVYENGEEVEGALNGSFFDVRNDATFGSADNFTDLFRVIVVDKPVDIRAFAKALVADFGGNQTKIDRLYTILQRHGIFWTRGRFAANEFVEDGPPNDADLAEDGNFRLIGLVPFMRGTVTINSERLGNADLGVRARIPADKVRVAYRQAFINLNGNPTMVLGQTAETDVSGAASAQIELDTTTLMQQGPMGEGDWDLLIQARNEDKFWDAFLPSWNGDANTDANKDEKYLKNVGTWYDVDRNHATETARQGLILVDNKLPEVVAGSFKPQ